MTAYMVYSYAQEEVRIFGRGPISQNNLASILESTGYVVSPMKNCNTGEKDRRTQADKARAQDLVLEVQKAKTM